VVIEREYRRFAEVKKAGNLDGQFLLLNVVRIKNNANDALILINTAQKNTI
jgi:hypothetical protein